MGFINFLMMFRELMAAQGNSWQLMGNPVSSYESPRVPERTGLAGYLIRNPV